MLNRTNRTLSANTNRLNLGTRMLEQNASNNNGSLTLRTAPVSFATVRVRTGVTLYPDTTGIGGSTMPPPKPAPPTLKAMSGSSFRATSWGPQAPQQRLDRPDQADPLDRSQAFSEWLSSLPGSLGEHPGSREITMQGHPRTASNPWHCEVSTRATRFARVTRSLRTGALPPN